MEKMDMSEHESNRNDLGHFAAGWSGGPGRPANPYKRRYADALAGQLSDEQWRGIVNRAINDATNGDHRARAWLSDHVMGRPTPTLNLYGADAALLSDVLRAITERGLSPDAILKTLLEE